MYVLFYSTLSYFVSIDEKYFQQSYLLQTAFPWFAILKL